MRDGVDRCVQRPRDFGMAMVESVVCYLSGRLDDAQSWAEIVFEIGSSRFPESWALNAYAALLLGNRRAQGRAGELHQAIQHLLSTNPNFPSWQASAAYVAREAEQRDVSNAALDALALDGFSSLVEDGSFTAIVGILSETAAELDRADDAAILYELLKPFSGRMSWTGLSTLGPVDASLAIVAAACGDDEAETAHLATAAALTEALRQLDDISKAPPTLR